MPIDGLICYNSARSFCLVRQGSTTAMFTVRRKLMMGVGLVLAMVGTLAASSLSAILSYREVVNDLDRNLRLVPQRHALIESLTDLQEPLLPLPDKFNGRLARQQMFEDRLSAAETQLANELVKLRNLSAAEYPSTYEIAQTRLWEIDNGLQELRDLLPDLGDSKTADETVARLMIRVAFVSRIAMGLPEFGNGLTGLLRSARETYWASFLWVTISTALVVLLLGGVVIGGYRWIFKPWAKLIEGASRVAQGKFEYRLRLNTNDEFAELADSFNRMTARFVEIRNDLDRQVHERTEQILRQERLAGLGFLAAGIAHEINNPLTAIRWTSESLVSRIDAFCKAAAPQDRALAENYLKMIQSEAVRCQQITAKLLDFARSEGGQRSRNDLTMIIQEVIKLVRAMSKYHQCAIVFERTAPCFLEVDGNEMKQVVLNLVANALDAMEAPVVADRRVRLAAPQPADLIKPTEQLSESPEQLAKGKLEIRLQEFTDHVEVEFQDSGCGMTPEVLRNIFVPFYTTKPSGQGTGLGLPISHRIVTDHAGRLAALSDGPGHGSTFRLSLPRSAKTQTEAA
ncbi:MAG: ATP-binding protein [Planctomycetia bacterium]|nr:ATP-binding protein [Planctomycetia bacterium]